MYEARGWLGESRPPPRGRPLRTRYRFATQDDALNITVIITPGLESADEDDQGVEFDGSVHRSKSS